MVQLALDNMGQEEFEEWARENKTDFMKICARMIPQSREVSGPEGKPIERRDVTEYSEAELLAILEAPGPQDST